MEPDQTIHVLVAETLPIVRDGLIAQLRGITSLHIHAVAVGSVKSLRSLIAVRQFNYLFISPAFDPDFSLTEFRQSQPTLPLIAIVSSLSQMPVSHHFADFVTVFDTPEKLVRILEANEASASDAIVDDDPNLLSAREKEILANLAKGLSNKQVADRLCLSVYTVMTHRRNICRKLKIHSLSGLTIYAIANRLIDV